MVGHTSLSSAAGELTAVASTSAVRVRLQLTSEELTEATWRRGGNRLSDASAARHQIDAVIAHTVRENFSGDRDRCVNRIVLAR